MTAGTMARIPLLVAILFVLVAWVTPSQAQIHKLRAEAFAYKYVLDGEWTDWTDWEDVSIIVTIDTDKERIKIYSKETQIYHMAKDAGKSIDEDGDETWEILCIDEDGKECSVRLVILHSQGNQGQLYVDYPEMTFVYNVAPLE